MWKKVLLLGGAGVLVVAIVLVMAALRQPSAPAQRLAVHTPDEITKRWSVEHLKPTGQAPLQGWIPPVITYDNYQSAYGPLPRSLMGTQIPLYLQIDENGQLAVTEALRQLFDYFFKTDGEESRDTIIARVRELLNTLPDPARERSLQLLEQYIALKKEELELQNRLAEDFKASGRHLDLAERARLVRELRAGQLDDEAYQAFYGDQDKRDEYAIKRMEIMRDTTLDPQQQEAALAAIEENLPADDRAVHQGEREAQQLDKRIAEARATGASDAEIFHLRETVYGTETAQRYVQADQAQAAWDGRISTYREQRAAILNSAALSDDDKNSQIESLRTQLFDTLEQKRIPVIDRMLDTEQNP